MIACDPNAVTRMRRAGAALAAVLGVAGLTGTVLAQGAPTRLFPVAPPAAPSAAAPSAAAPSAAAPAGTPKAPKTRSGGFQVEQLPAVSGDSFGLLEGDAGLGLDLWRGTRRRQIVELLSVMPGATRSHAMNALARRVLLTTATVPPPDFAGAAKGPSLLALRARHLAALGDYEDVAKLIAAAPGRITDEALLRLSVEGSLLGGDNAGACRRVREVGGQFSDVFWRKALIFCQAIVGERSQANLGAALMREQHPKGEATFHTLLRAMLGDKQAQLAKLPSPTPLDIAMLNAAELPIPEDALDTHDAGMLAAFARNEGLPPEMRVAVAERAEAVGTLPTAELAQIYGTMKFKPAQLSNALSEADSLGGAQGRALLYVAQRSQSNAAARAELLQKAFVSARAAGLYATALRLYAPVLKEIPATDDLGWFAGEAARADFVLGRPVDARAWISAGRSFRPASGAEGATAEVASFPYAMIASEKPLAWDAGRFQRWKQAQGTAAPVRTTLLLTLLEGLDRAAPDGAWDGLARVQIDPAAHLPSPAVMRRLEVAAATERRGAAVLAALATLGGEGPAGCSPLVLGMVIAALRNIGLQADARALALDAATGGGL